MSFRHRLLAEFGGTAALLAIVVGSGIMGEQLAYGNAAVALLANSLASAAGLYVLLTLLAPISGAHFNPLVSLIFYRRGVLAGRETSAYVLAQIAGALAGVWLAHLMFGLPLLQWGGHQRSGVAQFGSEVVASFGLLGTVLLGLRVRPHALPALVACYVLAAYWFTASTAFANPALTLARALTASFAGIRPIDVPGFLLAQLAAAVLVMWLDRLLGNGPAATA